MRVVNLTPHVVRVYRGDIVVATYPPSGRCARLRERVDPAGDLMAGDLEAGMVALSRVLVSYAPEVDDLPEPVEDTAYLVSRVLASAVQRTDLFFPWGEVRDAGGGVIGCRALAQFSPGERPSDA